MRLCDTGTSLSQQHIFAVLGHALTNVLLVNVLLTSAESRAGTLTDVISCLGTVPVIINITKNIYFLLHKKINNKMTAMTSTILNLLLLLLLYEERLFHSTHHHNDVHMTHH